MAEGKGSNMLIILYDCVASKGMKGRTNHLVTLRFSGRHSGISVWVLALQITSIAKPFRWNVAVIVLFLHPSKQNNEGQF